MVTRTALVVLVLCVSAAPAWSRQDRKPPDFDTLLAQAMQLHQAGDLIGAIDAYEAALRLQPDRGDARSNLGAAFVRLGRFDDAIAQYQKALQSAPQDPAIQFNLALAYYKAARFADAIPLLDKVATGQPENKAAVLLLGDSLMQQGEYQRVVDLLSPREATFPDDLAFGYILGTALLRTGERERGQVYIDRIFKAGDSAEARLLMGTALLQQRDYQGAVIELRKAVELNPQLPTVRTMYARALMGSGDGDAAAREFLRALQGNPNDFEANLHLGALRRRDQRNDEALVYLQRAMRLRPHDASARFATAGVLMAVGKVEEATGMLEQVVKAEPEFTEAHVLLATSYYRLKRKDDGDRHKVIADRLRLERQDREPRPGELALEPPTDAAVPQQ